MQTEQKAISIYYIQDCTLAVIMLEQHDLSNNLAVLQDYTKPSQTNRFHKVNANALMITSCL